MFKPKHFANNLDSFARQVLPPEVYAKRGIKGLELLDSRMLEFIDLLRFNLGLPITINGSGYTQSGLRTVGHYGTLSKMATSFSQHKYGRGLDFRVKDMTASEVRSHIIRNKNLYPDISFIEVGPVKSRGSEVPMSWVHCDCRTRLTEEQIRYWSPVLGFVSEEDVLSKNL